MQALLSFEQSPPISAPLRFFLTAPLFGMLAGALLLWGGPVALLILGIIALVRYQRRRAERVAAEDKPLSADEASRADALLKELDNK